MWEEGKEVREGVGGREEEGDGSCTYVHCQILSWMADGLSCISHRASNKILLATANTTLLTCPCPCVCRCVSVCVSVSVRACVCVHVCIYLSVVKVMTVTCQSDDSHLYPTTVVVTCD